MYMYSVPMLGSAITVELMDKKEAMERGLGYETPAANAKALAKPGDVFLTSPRNCPIIAVAARSEVVVAHTGGAEIGSVVSWLIKRLTKRKVPTDEIAICMQLGDEMSEQKFWQPVLRAGICRAWTMLPLDLFPQLVDARKGKEGWNYIGLELES